MLTGLLTSGAFGILGSLATNVLGYFTKKQADTQQLAMEKEKRATAIAMSEQQIRVAQVQGRIAVGIQDAKSFTASMQNDKAAYASEEARNSVLMLVVDFVRGMIRPILTISLIVMTWLIYNDMQTVIASVGSDKAFDVDRAILIITQTVEAILYLSTLTVGWWFGDRSAAKHTNKING